MIWLGKDPSENELKVYNSWKSMHPNWEVKLWRDKEADELIQSIRKEFPNVGDTWDKAESFAEKADVLRYSILYRNGGFYADTDLPCFGNLKELHFFSEFYSAIEQIDYPEMSVCNAALGARQNHPILKEVLKGCRPKNVHETKLSILERTGPKLLTRCIKSALEKDQKDNSNNTLVLPSAYFFPLPYYRSMFSYGSLPKEQATLYVTPFTKGLHLWNGSWS